MGAPINYSEITPIQERSKNASEIGEEDAPIQKFNEKAMLLGKGETKKEHKHDHHSHDH
jgi:hypothetical protein